MSKLRCHRCGRAMTEGSLKYQVVVQICSLFDGVIPETERAKDGAGLGQLLEEINGLGEEELNRQVYEDDAFILCSDARKHSWKRFTRASVLKPPLKTVAPI